MKFNVFLFLFLTCITTLQFSSISYTAEPDTLKVFDVSSGPEGHPPTEWVQKRPDGELLFTDYSILRSIDGYYLRARTNGTGSWLEYEFEEGLDISEYPVMAWRWKVDRHPEVEWEKNDEEDDFALRVELVYDLPGNKWNPVNIAKKGLIPSLFKGNPPELITSYVWSVSVPSEKPYESPESDRMTVIPIQSTKFITGRWLMESRNVADDLDSHQAFHNLVLKKIRIRADTDNSLSISESGLTYIYLIGKSE